MAALSDWEFGALSSITAELDPDAVHHDGLYSMRVDFTRNDNVEFYGLRELALVAPGRYRLDAWMRTAAITSAEGMRMRVKSYLNNIELAGKPAASPVRTTGRPCLSPSMLPAGVNIVEVAPCPATARSASTTQGLTGKVWLDSVTLTRLH